MKTLKLNFKNNTFKVILGITLVASGFLIYTSLYSENVFSSAMNMVVVPIQGFLLNLSDSAKGIVPEIKPQKELEAENNNLKNEVNELRKMVADYHTLKKRNEEYEKYLGFKQEREDLNFVMATAIGRDPMELFYGFTINKGAEAGIAEGDSVITENGFVGYVFKVEKGASKVKTILSPELKLSASDSSSGDMGVISGSIKLCEEGLTGLSLIPSQNTIKQGDIITTTGFSGMYPKNLLIGKVKEIDYDNLNSSVCAVIEPFEDIKNVKDVLVITGFKGEGEISKEAMVH